mmetsp:Transcript_30598/g.55802  ORF Transcript_30598/g.55802 Transcript_30598/m.55802 type:complete len:252 (-) Transcript_30598:663-1418(-)
MLPQSEKLLHATPLHVQALPLAVVAPLELGAVRHQRPPCTWWPSLPARNGERWQPARPHSQPLWMSQHALIQHEVTPADPLIAPSRTAQCQPPFATFPCAASLSLLASGLQGAAHSVAHHLLGLSAGVLASPPTVAACSHHLPEPDQLRYETFPRTPPEMSTAELAQSTLPQCYHSGLAKSRRNFAVPAALCDQLVTEVPRFPIYHVCPVQLCAGFALLPILPSPYAALWTTSLLCCVPHLSAAWPAVARL